MKIRLTDLREGNEFVRFLVRMISEGRGLKKSQTQWTQRDLADAISKVSPRNDATINEQTVSRWTKGRYLPAPPAFGYLCQVFWPSVSGPAVAERREFETLYRAARAAWNYRRKVAPPAEMTAWEYFVMLAREDCSLLGKEERCFEEADLRLFETGEYLYIHPSPELPDFCAQNPAYEYACRRDRSFAGDSNFDQLADETGENKLSEWIERYRAHTSGQIMAQLADPAYRYKPYNREQYGVRSIDFGVAHEGVERSTVSIALYRTDFFTNRVMRNIYLRELKHDPRFANLEKIPFFSGRNFSCLFTSLGMNCNVILRSKRNADQLVLNKTALLANENQAFRWHVAMNEGVNLEDQPDASSSTVSIRNTVLRGLKEEFGAGPLLQQSDVMLEYFSVFVTRTNMEVGIHAAATLQCAFSELIDQRAMHARDDRRESSAIDKIPFTPISIKNFAAKKAKGNFVTYTPLLLDELIRKRL